MPHSHGKMVSKLGTVASASNHRTRECRGRDERRQETYDSDPQNVIEMAISGHLSPAYANTEILAESAMLKENS